MTDWLDETFRSKAAVERRMNWLVLTPIICGAVMAAGILLPSASAAMYYRVVLILAALATAVSAIRTTGAFAWGDTLFVCWLLLGGGYALAALRYAIRLIGLGTGEELLSRPVLDAMLIAQNIAIAMALWTFVAAWRATGLVAPGSPGARRLWTLTGVGIALGVGMFPLIQGIRTASADTVLVISTIGDIVGIALIVPLAMSALALRGGLLMYTWILLAASEAFWLCYDVWVAARTAFHYDGGVSIGIEQIVRVIAIAFALSATVAQRRAVS